MAIADPYATAEEYRAVISPDRDDGDDALITTDLVAISRYLDGKLGEFFSRDAADVTIVVDVACPDWRRPAPLAIHAGNTRPSLPPLVSVTSVAFGTATPLLSAGLELWPTGAPLQPEPEPYREIRPAYPSGTAFGGGRATIVCQRGWPQVPAAINAGTIQLAALLRLETPRATRRIPELGEAIETSPSAIAIVYRLVEMYKTWWIA
jgi:hypothetical protein